MAAVKRESYCRACQRYRGSLGLGPGGGRAAPAPRVTGLRLLVETLCTKLNAAIEGQRRRDRLSFKRKNVNMIKPEEIAMLKRVLKAGERRPLRPKDFALLFTIRFAVKKYERSDGIGEIEFNQAKLSRLKGAIK